jgi:hypothetical protein
MLLAVAASSFRDQLRSCSAGRADPDEGVEPDGTIVTGVRRDRVPAAFEPVVHAAVSEVGAVDSSVQLYMHGSVATGRARIGESDVDLLSVGLPAYAAEEIGRELSHRFRALCRAVEVGAARPEDVVGSRDEAYGLRVFLRHYCVQLAGEPRADLAPAYPADVRAARGFNGDIAAHARRWREALDQGDDLSRVGNRLARKTLLAVASLVSVHDGIWTTAAREPPAAGQPSIRPRPRTCGSLWTGPRAPWRRPCRTSSVCSTARSPVWSGCSGRRSACGPAIVLDCKT